MRVLLISLAALVSSGSASAQIYNSSTTNCQTSPNAIHCTTTPAGPQRQGGGTNVNDMMLKLMEAPYPSQTQAAPTQQQRPVSSASPGMTREQLATLNEAVNEYEHTVVVEALLSRGLYAEGAGYLRDTVAKDPLRNRAKALDFAEECDKAAAGDQALGVILTARLRARLDTLRLSLGMAK